MDFDVKVRGIMEVIMFKTVLYSISMCKISSLKKKTSIPYVNLYRTK